MRKTAPAKTVPGAGVRLLTLHEVLAATTISKSALYNLMRDLGFPPSVHHSPNQALWIAAHVYSWMASRIYARSAMKTLHDPFPPPAWSKEVEACRYPREIQFLRAEEAARRLRVSVGQFYNLIPGVAPLPVPVTMGIRRWLAVEIEDVIDRLEELSSSTASASSSESSNPRENRRAVPTLVVSKRSDPVRPWERNWSNGRFRS